MHDGAETQGIVEVLSEHDSHEMRLSGVVRASAAKILFFVHIANTSKKQKLLMPGSFPVIKIQQKYKFPMHQTQQ